VLVLKAEVLLFTTWLMQALHVHWSNFHHLILCMADSRMWLTSRLQTTRTVKAKLPDNVFHVGVLGRHLMQSLPQLLATRGQNA